jgi:hypothetical protein
MGFFVWFENSERIERLGATSASEHTSASLGVAKWGSNMSDEGKGKICKARFLTPGEFN